MTSSGKSLQNRTRRRLQVSQFFLLDHARSRFVKVIQMRNSVIIWQKYAFVVLVDRPQTGGALDGVAEKGSRWT